VLTSPCLDDLQVGQVFMLLADCLNQLRLPSRGPTITSACV
jgi:hypothetical protein